MGTFVHDNGDITDNQGHGTGMASLIGANGNNGIGFAGMDWKCKLMICKVKDTTDLALIQNLAKAIRYAVVNGTRTARPTYVLYIVVGLKDLLLMGWSHSHDNESMKFLVLLLVLFSARNAQSQYLLEKKNDRNASSADIVCFNKGRDSLTLVFKGERTTIPLDTVDDLTFRERKRWRPYLLTAALVGGSTYTFFHFASRDDAMYTAEGKARFAGFFWGGITLLIGATVKELMETHHIIHLRLGINRTEALIICAF